MRCPLYLFVFMPRRGSDELLEVLRSAPGQLFVTPAPHDGNVALEITKPSGAGHGDLHVNAAQPGRPLSILYGAPAGATSGVVSSKLMLTANLEASLARLAADDSLEARVSSTNLSEAGPTLWTPVTDTAKAWVAIGSIAREPRTLQVSAPMSIRTRSQMVPTGYRIELWSTGRPSWLADFDAPQQNDDRRTYGLASLFNYLKPTPTQLTTLFAAVY